METIVNLETRQLTHDTTLPLLNRYPDVRGIYVAGGGMEGAIAALRQTRAPGEVVLVVNELTAESHAALASRWVTKVTATSLADLCRTVIGLKTRDGDSAPVADDAQHFLQAQLLVTESI